jgi:hypothetical protein
MKQGESEQLGEELARAFREHTRTLLLRRLAVVEKEQLAKLKMREIEIERTLAKAREE